MKVHNGLELPGFLHGSEIWTLTQKDKKRLSSRLNFCEQFVCHKRNEEILEELIVESVEEKTRRYK
jgi:hypothetical protein